ncbi:MAG: cytochrome C [Desulfobacterales bacterium]|nr:cytochrome C [Desulfobacterales bacterium]
MMISRKIAVAAGVVGIIVLICTFACEKRGALRLSAAAPEKNGPAKQEMPAAYKKEVKPLTPAECGRCHFSVFDAIKKEGGKHRIDCVRCHTKFHAYSPRKKNYNKIMPKCASCHVSKSGGPFHGKDSRLTPCLRCHADPHKPLAIRSSKIETSCDLCHKKQSNEIKEYPSKHKTDVSCTDCHAEKHGNIPECSECHDESHSPDVALSVKECMACHPVHKPTQITYGKETLSTICAGCHKKAYGLLQKKVTKHTRVKCAECHPAHKKIPACTVCHKKPHPRSMTVDLTKCGSCHGIAHALAS